MNVLQDTGLLIRCIWKSRAKTCRKVSLLFSAQSVGKVLNQAKQTLEAALLFTPKTEKRLSARGFSEIMTVLLKKGLSSYHVLKIFHWV